MLHPEPPAPRRHGLLGHMQFRCSAAPAIFGAGAADEGPLRLAFDTDLVIDPTQRHEHVVADLGFGGLHPDLWFQQDVAFGDVLSVWFWRDVRVLIPEGVLIDANKELAPERMQLRVEALAAFAHDRWLREFDPADVTRSGPTPVDALPPKRDGELVAEAWRSGAHVFLTRDRRVLGHDARLAPHGLRLFDPTTLLGALRSAGEFTEGPPVEPFLLPDPQMLTTLFGLAGD